MESVVLGRSGVRSSRLVYGCMRIAEGGPEKGARAIRAALDEGYTHFDHADIYGEGECEKVFGRVLKESPGLRERVVITTKCGVIFTDRPEKGDPGRYDLSRDHIVRSVEGSLRRLGAESVDFLLLHRPDPLMDAREVASAFDLLERSGKVQRFGVSNFPPSKVAFLRSVLSAPLHMNQVEINIHRADAFVDGTLDQCGELGMTPTAWCPLGGVAYPAWGNTFPPETEARIRREINRQAAAYGTEDWIVILAWLLRHPSGIAPIVGTTTPARIAAAKKALEIDYDRKDWYRLWEARNGKPVP